MPFVKMGHMLRLNLRPGPGCVTINRALPGAVREPKEPKAARKVVPQKEQRDHYTTLSIGFALKVDEPLVHIVEALFQLVVVFRDGFADVGFDVVSHRSEPGVQ